MKKQRWRRTKINKHKTCIWCHIALPGDIRRTRKDKRVFCSDKCYNEYWSFGISDADYFDPFHPINIMNRRVNND